MSQVPPDVNGSAPASGVESVTRSTFKAAVGGVLSLGGGLVSQVATAALFGAGPSMDAFLTALVVPTYMTYVLISGLSFVLIPAFIREEARGASEDAWALVGTFFRLTAIALLAASVAGAIFARRIIAATAPGFGPEKSALAARMLSVLMFTVVLVGLQSVMTGIQNARNRFFWPAAAIGIGSLANALVLIALRRRLGPMALVWGNLANMVVAAGIPTIPVLRHGWTRRLPLRDERVRRTIRLILPFFAFVLVTRSVQVFERMFASGLPDGDLSYLGYAHKIAGILIIVLAGSVAQATFPALARAHARSGDRGLSEQTRYGFRLTFAAGFPACLLLGAAAVPLVKVLYERGAFRRSDTAKVAAILLVVLAGDVMLRMIGNIISRTFYVLRDTLTFPLVSAAAVGLYFPMARALTRSMGYFGLALALPLQLVVGTAVVYALMVFRVKGYPSRRTAVDAGLSLAAAGSGAAVAWAVTRAAAAAPAALRLTGALGAGGAAYIIALLILDREMAASLLEMMGLARLAGRLREAAALLPRRREGDAGGRSASGDVP